MVDGGGRGRQVGGLGVRGLRDYVDGWAFIFVVEYFLGLDYRFQLVQGKIG